MKKITAIIVGLGITFGVNAQTLLYQWAFTNVTDTVTNSSPSYAITPGTGNLFMTDVSGAGAAGVNLYFTNANTGPGAGPGVDAMGALVANANGYNTGNSASVLATNLNLGNLFQFTVTFWVRMDGFSGQFTRFVQFANSLNYDVGGKGGGNHNGVGASLNGWNGNNASQEQNGIANASQAQQQQVTITGNSAFPNGLMSDASTWYFEAITYDGTKMSQNFITWIGTLATNVQPFILDANYGPINFTTNAIGFIAGNDVPGSARALSTGLMADVRIYSGIVSSTNLERIRQFQPPILDTNPVSPASVAVQPKSGSSFVGGTRTFSVTAVGNPSTFNYIWRSNNVVVSGATNSSLTLSNIQLSANAASFVCSVSNVIGGTNSLPAVATVRTVIAGTYAQAVVANNPYSFWLINEPTNVVNTPIVVSDYVGGHDGTAQDPTNTLFANNGPSSPNYPGFPANNPAIEIVKNGFWSRIDLAGPGNFVNTGMTIAGWVYTPAIGTSGDGIIFNLVSDTGGGFGMIFGGNNELDYQWGPLAANVASGLNIPLNEWTFVALVVSTNGTSDTNATLYLGAHSVGFLSAQDSAAASGDNIANGTDVTAIDLGRTPFAFSENGGGIGAFSAVSDARFSDVAVFYSALSPTTLSNMYFNAAGIYLYGSLDPNTPDNILLTYPVGILQSANSVNGTYSDVIGASSPYSTPVTGSQGYFRLRQ